MNCKPGDLAIVCNGGVNSGKLVRIVDAYAGNFNPGYSEWVDGNRWGSEHYYFCWNVESMAGPFMPPTLNENGIVPCMRRPYCDIWLRPLKPPSESESQETKEELSV